MTKLETMSEVKFLLKEIEDMIFDILNDQNGNNTLAIDLLKHAIVVREDLENTGSNE